MSCQNSTRPPTRRPKPPPSNSPGFIESLGNYRYRVGNVTINAEQGEDEVLQAFLQATGNSLTKKQLGRLQSVMKAIVCGSCGSWPGALIALRNMTGSSRNSSSSLVGGDAAIPGANPQRLSGGPLSTVRPL